MANVKFHKRGGFTTVQTSTYSVRLDELPPSAAPQFVWLIAGVVYLKTRYSRSFLNDFSCRSENTLSSEHRNLSVASRTGTHGI